MKEYLSLNPSFHTMFYRNRSTHNTLLPHGAKKQNCYPPITLCVDWDMTLLIWGYYQTSPCQAQETEGTENLKKPEVGESLDTTGSCFMNSQSFCCWSKTCISESSQYPSMDVWGCGLQDSTPCFRSCRLVGEKESVFLRGGASSRFLKL